MTSLPIAEPRTLADLSKPQWEAALNCARVLVTCDPNDAGDRARYRGAKDAFAELLPAGTDVRNLITRAVRWNAMNSFVSAVAGIPRASIESQTHSQPGRSAAQEAAPEYDGD